MHNVSKFLVKRLKPEPQKPVGPAGQGGSVLIYNIVVIFIFSVVLLGVLTFATIQLRLTRSSVNREMAFHIAEAGVNYYQWRLAHFPTDFYDGNASSSSPGPYVHDFIDKDTDEIVGRYSLIITPPLPGSTVVNIESTGYTLENPAQKRIISVKYGIDSLASYAFLTNAAVWVGDTEHVDGQFRANGGIRFDGTGNAPIMSAKTTYLCTPPFGCSPTSTQPGIWGSAPTSTQNFWQFPVQNIDFNTITANLATLKSTAQADGEPAYLSPSNKQGYSFVFTSNGKVDIYSVKKVENPPAQAWDVNGQAVNTSVDYDPNPAQRQLLYSQASIPPSGIFYVEDKVWVEGVVNGHVQIVAAQLPYNPNTAPKIIIPNNITYAAYDGSCVLGLLSQKDIVISYNAPDNLVINGALVAQNGSIQVYQYAPSTNIKNSITVSGSIISYGPWAWSYVDVLNNVVSGFTNTYTTYDSNLLYNPPPSFPAQSTDYEQLSWTSN